MAQPPLDPNDPSILIAVWGDFNNDGRGGREARSSFSERLRGGRLCSLLRSDLYVDRQVQFDQACLQQRHRQIILQFDPGLGVAGSAATPLEDDLAGLPQLGVEAGNPYAIMSDRRVPYTVRAA